MNMLDFVYFEQTFCQPFLGKESFVEEVCLARNIFKLSMMGEAQIVVCFQVGREHGFNKKLY
jgi:hypothetical protein